MLSLTGQSTEEVLMFWIPPERAVPLFFLSLEIVALSTSGDLSNLPPLPFLGLGPMMPCLLGLTLLVLLTHGFILCNLVICSPALFRIIVPSSSRFLSRNRLLAALAVGSSTYLFLRTLISGHQSQISGLYGNLRSSHLTHYNLGGILVKSV